MEVASQHCDTAPNKTKDILDTVKIERIFRCASISCTGDRISDWLTHSSKLEIGNFAVLVPPLSFSIRWEYLSGQSGHPGLSGKSDLSGHPGLSGHLGLSGHPGQSGYPGLSGHPGLKVYFAMQNLHV